ncbi:MAG TPA: hypothetical protein DCY88_05030 [Cyanobacteria bacterium UBA11372]|nr:hypothetical protein [Cyanobacteria bacterium UBA11372]
MTPKFYPIGEGYRIVLAKAPVRHPAKYQEVQAIARDENQAIIFQERVELENLKQELEVQRAQFEFERTQLKRNFYNSIIQSKNLQLLASQLANNPGDVAIILQIVEEQQIFNRNDQIWLLKALLENDALEEWRLSEASQLLLQKLTQLSEQEEVWISLDNDSDARERQLVWQNTLLGSRDALVVGINQYPFLKGTPTSKAQHLSVPASDAEAIAQCLEKYGEFRVRRLPATIQDDSLRVATEGLLKTDALEDAIIQLFNPVGQKIPETALLYFCGHGLSKNRGGVTEDFLATSDTHPQRNQWGVSLWWLREILRRSPVRQQIIWLDCPHSGELLNFFEVDIEDDKKPDRCFIIATSDLSKALLQGLDPKWQPNKQVTSQTLVDFIRQALKKAPQHPICFSSGNPIILTTEQPIISPITNELPLEKSITYELWLNVSKNIVSVGGELEVIVYQNLTNADKNNAYLLEITQEEAKGSELNIMLTAPGFQFDGANTASLPIDPNTAQTAQTACFRLTALRFGTATITAELYRGNTFETNLETQVEVAGVDLPPKPIKTQPRPVPQPDFILRVQTVWNETNSACKFQYQIRSFRLPSLFPGEINYHSELLSSSWIEQMRGLLGTTLENISDALPEDGRSHLTSLGQYLFQHLFPTELQSDFRNLIPRDRTFTLLILADQDASLPWELLHDGQRFLSDRFIIGRWFWELNNTRPHEFPVGAINVAHYNNVEQPELWTALLEPPGAPPPLPLPDGVLGNLESTEAMRGLHLIRYSQSADAANRRNAPITLDDTNNAQDIERQMRPAKLNLRRNRPLVSLGYVRRDRPELTTLEQTWASAFIRAGCSAFTGSLWAVDPAVEAAFISGFYNRLWTGDSLGEAFEASRQLARAVAPDSLDWLAYVLFGDPMARPYRPVEGKGYAVVEPIGREIDDPLPPGVPVRFRLSLRRTPPVWHEERVIEVAENLTFENLQAHVKTFGLQVTPDSPIAMSLAPTGNYLGWFTLVAPPEIAGNSALVQVFLMDGIQPIHSLMFSLNIENEGS